MSEAEWSPFPLYPLQPELWAAAAVRYLGTSGDPQFAAELAEALRHAQRLYGLPAEFEALAGVLELRAVADASPF